MKMKMAIAVLAAAFAVVLTAVGAPQPPKFDKVNPHALKYLKGEQGKPIKTGVVIVNGHYIKPPYKVSRYGNVIRINDIQVTGAVVSWNAFLATQDPSRVKKTVTEPSAAPAAAAPAAEEQKEPSADIFDDDLSFSAPSMASWMTISTGDALDDLFGDDEDETPSRPSRPSGGGVRRPPPPPKPPAPKVTYTLIGEFERNQKVEALARKVSEYRTKIDKHLRSGGLCIFTVGSAPKLLDARQAQEFVNVIPEILRDAKSGPDLIAKLRAKRVIYVDQSLGPLFLANRADYLQYQALREEYRRDAATRRVMGGY